MGFCIDSLIVRGQGLAWACSSDDFWIEYVKRQAVTLLGAFTASGRIMDSVHLGGLV